MIRIVVLHLKRITRGLATTRMRRPYGLLPWDRMGEALRVAQVTGQPLHRVLVQLQLVGEREIQQARARELGLGYVDLERVRFDEAANGLLPYEVLERHRTIPLKKKGRDLWLAVSEPGCRKALNEVGAITGLRVIPVLALPNQIAAALSKTSARSDRQ